MALEVSGFRISDILTLKTEDFLYCNEQGWWLVGDQMKPGIKGHRIPIVDEKVIAILLAQQEQTRKETDQKSNPKGYLFVQTSGPRKGKPFNQNWVSRVLNLFALECNINYQGKPYHFNSHAFRHRFGVTNINNGMNLVHVQTLLGHMSPEMTMTYARILDTTLRKSREEVLKRTGGLRINARGVFESTDLELQAIDNGLELAWIRHNMESIRMPWGFCVRDYRLNCEFRDQMIEEPPCIKNSCKSFHVDTSFVGYYQEQLDKIAEDLIEYSKNNQLRSMELAEKKIESYKRIIKDIQLSGKVYGLEKERREYVNNERNKVN